MDDIKFCPSCGGKIDKDDKFCEECGFNLESYKASLGNENPGERFEKEDLIQNTDKFRKINEDFVPIEKEVIEEDTYVNYEKPKKGKTPIIIASVLILVFLIGGGIYILLDKKDKEKNNNIVETPTTLATEEIKNNDDDPIIDEPEKEKENDIIEVDLTRASTYLAEAGTKFTAFVNYPNGLSGIVNRISGLVVPNEKVRVSEVETGIERGEDFGFVFHYVERVDGTYYILDDSPNEIFPVLKNNLSIGQSWDYKSEFGDIIWTVMNMGVDLDLGFNKFENCIVVEENNKAADFISYTYYAPGKGTVYVADPGGGDLYKLTAMESIGLEEAGELIMKWSPNYLDIDDDRTVTP